MRIFGIELSPSKRNLAKAEVARKLIYQAKQARQYEAGLSIAKMMIDTSNSIEQKRLKLVGEEVDSKKIVIYQLPKNGSSFTILSTFPSKECSYHTFGTAGQPIHQVSINMGRSGEEIYLLKGYEEQEIFWSIDQIETAKSWIKRDMEDYVKAKFKKIAI